MAQCTCLHEAGVHEVNTVMREWASLAKDFKRTYLYRKRQNKKWVGK